LTVTALEAQLLSALKAALRQFVPAIPPHDPNRHYLDQIKAAVQAADPDWR
jgi:hypothetical protein